MEQEMKDYVQRIEQLKITVGGQELSGEDVRRMKRDTERYKEYIAKETSKLDGHVAAHREAQEKWSAVYKLLEETVDKYNTKARQLELIPQTAENSKGLIFEVKLDKSKAAEGELEMMGGMDIASVLEGHVMDVVRQYDGYTASEQRRKVEVESKIRTMKNSLVQTIENIEVSLELFLFLYKMSLKS